MLHPFCPAAEGHKSSPAAALNFKGYNLSRARVVSFRRRRRPKLGKSALTVDSA